MSRAAMVAAGASLAVAGFAAWMAGTARDRADDARAASEAAASDAAAAARAVASIEEDLSRLEASLAEARTAAEALRARIDAAAAAPRGDAAFTLPVDDAPADAPRPPAAPKSRFDPVLRREWEDLVEKVLGGKPATAEEQERFWRLVKGEGFMDGLLAELESAVAADPKNIDARMTLSTGYVTKLFTVPPGPEMGTWASKAEGQWKAVLEIDEKHWEARNALAVSYSHYPEFLNKTPDAILEFERVRRLQEAELPPDARQAGVYTSLAMLYNRQHNREKAREALEAGSRRHPDSEAIRKALATMGN